MLVFTACAPREEGAPVVAGAPPREFRSPDEAIDAGQQPAQGGSMKCLLDFDDGTHVELAEPLSIIDLKGAWSITGQDEERKLGLSFSFEDAQARAPGDYPLPPKYGYDRPRVYVIRFEMDGETVKGMNLSSTRGGTLHFESPWNTPGSRQHVIVEAARNDEFHVTVRRCDLSLIHP